MSSAPAVTSCPPSWRVVVATVPSTVTTWLERLIKFVSPDKPILLPDITTFPAFTVVPVIVPAVTDLVPSRVISPNPDAIEPTDKAPTVWIVVPPAIGANCASAVVVLILVASWSLTLVAPIPLRVLSSAVVMSCPSNILISAASAVTVPIPNVNEDAVRLPLTVNLLLSRASKFTSVLIPIWEPLILTVPTSAEPDVTFPVVVTGPVISILVNPLTIEPADKSPTVSIVVPPAIGANCASAVVVFIFVASWSLTLVAPMPLRVFNSAVVISWPSKIFRSVMPADNVSVPIVNEDAVRLPFTVSFSSSRASKFRSVLVPIWEPLILIVPKSAVFEVTLPVVVTGPVISIFVKPLTIEPTDRAPTSPNVSLPVFNAYVVEAAEASNLVPNLVSIS